MKDSNLPGKGVSRIAAVPATPSSRSMTHMMPVSPGCLGDGFYGPVLWGAPDRAGLISREESPDAPARPAHRFGSHSKTHWFFDLPQNCPIIQS